MSSTIRFTSRTTPQEITIVYGAQCSGKSTFLSTVCEKTQIVSLGESVRAMSDERSIKVQANSLIVSGKEWPVELGYKFIVDKITEETKVLDGYPRNLGELQYLLDKLGSLKSLTLVYFWARDDVLYERYKQRVREDMNIDFFRLRLKQAKQFDNDIEQFATRSHSFSLKHFRVNSV